MRKSKSAKFVTHAISALMFTCMVALSTNVLAAQVADKPIIVIGASFENAVTPISNDLLGPFGGFALGYGSYLSLGNALVRNEKLSGFVINEAMAGATTYTRQQCTVDLCVPVGWQGMDVQLQKALTRVTMRDFTGNIVGYNADYLIVGLPNDCLHSGAAGIPQAESSPCTSQQLNEVVDRLGDLASQAVAVGMTPVFNVMPKYQDLDLPLFQQAFGLVWVIDEISYNELRGLVQQRIQAEVPESLFVDGWGVFEHMGDGIHPTYETTEQAAKLLTQALRNHVQ